MEEIYNTIERYLDGDMDATEIAAFDKRCAEDADFNKRVSALKEVRQSLSQLWKEESNELALKEQLKTLSTSHFKSNSKNKTPTIERTIGRQFWAIAATFVAIIGAVYFFFLQPEQDLYASYREFPKANFTVRGTTSEEAMEAAEKAFNAGDYNNALPHFQKYLEEKPDDSEARFFYALALMENGSNVNAQDILEKLSKENTLWSDEADWYLILNDLKIDNKEKAITRLQKFDETNPHFAEANKLLNQLK